MTFTKEELERSRLSTLAIWNAGDFGALARNFGISEAEDFVSRLELPPGVRVLDLACGTGNVTIPLARRGVSVIGLDMTPRLLEEARVRATHEGLQLDFDQGFVEALPYPDAAFEVVVSMFGIMFSPAPERVTEEIARVLRPAGRLAMANWTQDGFSGLMTALVGRHLPAPPPGALSPFLWGDDETVRNRLLPHFDAVQTRVIKIKWDIPKWPVEAARFFVQNSGAVQLALSRLSAPQRDSLLLDFTQLWVDNNSAADGMERTIIENEYLETLAVRNE